MDTPEPILKIRDMTKQEKLNIKITGEIETFLRSLGCRNPDEKILDSIVLIGCEFEYEETYYDVKKSYWNFYKRGVSFCFTKSDSLRIIFFYMCRNDEYYKYPFLNTLIDGVGYDSSKDDLVKLFGKPSSYSDIWIKYMCNDKYVHFEFNKNEELSQITLGFESDLFIE